MAGRGDGTAADLPTNVIRTASGSLEYRWEPRDGPVIVVLHGGHMRAGLSLGEKVYRAAGYSLLVPSRPGYGATDLSVGAAPEGFADAVAVLCGLLGIDQVEACAGVSAGVRPPWPWLPGIPAWSAGWCWNPLSDRSSGRERERGGSDVSCSRPGPKARSGS